MLVGKRDNLSRLQTLLVFFILNGMAKTTLVILLFLCSGEIVKNSSDVFNESASEMSLSIMFPRNVLISTITTSSISDSTEWWIYVLIWFAVQMFIFFCVLRRMLQTQSNPRGQGKIPTTHEGGHYFKGCP